MTRPFDRLAATERQFAPHRPKRKAVPRLERLEDRAMPAQLLWVGPDWGFWHDPANWVDAMTEQPAGVAPGPEDDVLIDGERVGTSSVTGQVTAIHTLEMINFLHAVTVDDGDEAADEAPELTITGRCLVDLSQSIVVHGIFRGDEPGSPADILITGGGAGLTWYAGDIDSIHFVLDVGTNSLIRVAMDTGGGHSSLTGSFIENFGNVEVNHTVLGLSGNTVINNGSWLLNDLVYARYGGSSDFMNFGTFQVIGPINYWYFNVRNFGAADIGGTYPFVNYVGLLTAGDFDQGLPGIAIAPPPYTRISYGGSITVGPLFENTFSVFDGFLIVDGTINGSVATTPGTTFVAGTLDTTTGISGPGTATIEHGSISIGGTLLITVGSLQNGAIVASSLSAVGETLILGAASTLVIQNNGATPGDDWAQAIISAETVIGGFGSLVFTGLTSWIDANGVPHTWLVSIQSAPTLTQFILSVVSAVYG